MTLCGSGIEIAMSEAQNPTLYFSLSPCIDQTGLAAGNYFLSGNIRR